MEYTIVNGSNENLHLICHPIPYIPNPKKPIKDYDIFAFDFCKVGIPEEDTFFRIMGADSFIEFEVLKVDSKIHVTHASFISYKITSAGNKIQIEVIPH